MGILNGNISNEGFYEEDDYGDFTLLVSSDDFQRASKEGKLYHFDGYSLSRIPRIPKDSKIEEITFYNKYR
jgi:hypothetical protein